MFWSQSRVIQVDAIPPLKYPPKFNATKLLTALLCSVSIAVVLHSCIFPLVDFVLNQTIPSYVLALLCPFDCSLGEWSCAGPCARRSLKYVCQWILLAICGVAFVSRVTLERAAYFISRYGSRFELCRIAFVLPVLLFFGPLPSSAESESIASLAMHTVVPYFVALHFTFLDTSPVLQSVGCKLPLPSRWSTFTLVELVAILALIAVIGFGVSALVEDAWVYYQRSISALSMPYLFIMMATFIASGSSIPLPNWLRMRFGWSLQRPLFVHVHHYVQGLLLVPFTSHGSSAAQVAFAVALGIWIEGVTVWGMDPLLVEERPPLAEKEDCMRE
jgi:hypothetical protein